MQTSDLIVSELTRFMTANHPCRKPEHLYVGRHEHTQLLKQAAEFGMLDGSPLDDEMHRLEFRGMKVYAVDSQSFVGFGSAQPSPCG